MPKFSFMSWNVRMYKGSKSRLEDADELISIHEPDVVGLIEFRAKKQARELMFDRFSDYDFAVTDSTGGLEVIMGFKRGVFDQVITTQRRAFNNAPRTLRPGALLSVNFRGEWYSLLFLHTKSGATASAYELRKKAFSKIWSLEKALKAASPSNKANLIVLGDLNTMGNGNSITGSDEIDRLATRAESKRMALLGKDSSNTWHEWGKGPRGNRRKLKVSELNGAWQSDLDHVLASNTIDFVVHGNDGFSPIHVEGWQQLDGRERVEFLWSLSDHSALFGEVW